MTDRSRDAECHLRVGQTVICLEAPDSQLAKRLRDYFGVGGASGVADVRITIAVDPRDSWPVPDSLFVNKTITKRGFEIGGGIVKGTWSRDQRQAAVQVGEILFKRRLIRVFEQLLYQAFYSDPRNRKGNTFLLHSAGVIHGDGGYVFTGSSGAGKSTIARMSSQDKVLNDEICHIRLQRRGAVVSSTPFNGFFKLKTDGSAPLKSVLVLSHSRSHSIRPMQDSEIAVRVLPQVVPPIGLHEKITRDTLQQMLDLLADLRRRVPIMALAFRRDPGFWQQIEQSPHDGPRGGQV